MAHLFLYLTSESLTLTLNLTSSTASSVTRGIKNIHSSETSLVMSVKLNETLDLSNRNVVLGFKATHIVCTICFLPVWKLLICSSTKLRTAVNQDGHMLFSYRNDKDEFPVIGVQDSKYLPLCSDEPAREQLHFVTSEKLLPTIYSDSSFEHH